LLNILGHVLYNNIWIYNILRRLLLLSKNRYITNSAIWKPGHALVILHILNLRIYRLYVPKSLIHHKTCLHGLYWWICITQSLGNNTGDFYLIFRNIVRKSLYSLLSVVIYRSLTFFDAVLLLLHCKWRWLKDSLKSTR